MELFVESNGSRDNGRQSSVAEQPTKQYGGAPPPPAAHPGLPFAGDLCHRPRLAQPAVTVPFAAISSPPTFVAHVSPPATASPPTEAHVPLGLLVAYEGMCWSPALEPVPRQRPWWPLLASALQCRLLASAVQCRLLASALQCPCWFRSALQSAPESQRLQSCLQRYPPWPRKVP